MPTRRTAGTWLDSVDPGVTDDRSSDPLAPRVVGDRWVTDSGSTWTCWDDTPGAAQWVEEDGSGGGGGGGDHATLTNLSWTVSAHVAAAGGKLAAFSVSTGAAQLWTIDGTTLVLTGTTLSVGAIPEASVTGLVSDLAGKVPTTRTLTGTAPITVAGDNAPHDLAADRTIAVDAATTGATGVVRLATPSTDTTSGRVVQAQDTRVNYPSWPRTLTENVTLNPNRSVVIFGALDLDTFVLDLDTSILAGI